MHQHLAFYILYAACLDWYLVCKIFFLRAKQAALQKAEGVTTPGTKHDKVGLEKKSR